MFGTKKFPHTLQRDQMDCGPTCLKMVADYYGKSVSLPYLREQAHIDRQGVSLLGISDAAEQIGFRTIAVKTDYSTLAEEAPFPCIVHWNQNHFVVVHNIKKDKVYVADPAESLLVYTKEEFMHCWIGAQERTAEGIVLILEPSPDFYQDDFLGEAPDKTSLTFLFKYLKPYHKLIIQVFLGLITGSILSLLLPLLTQALVDTGVNKQDLSVIYVILIAQLMLFVGKTAIDIIRSWILLHISSRVN